MDYDYRSEEEKVTSIAALKRQKVKAYSKIPYALINEEIEGSAKDVLDEFTELAGYYDAYDKGAKFITEGTAGDYVAADLCFKLAAGLINKEARFLFAEPPDITIDTKGDVGRASQEVKDTVTNLQNFLSTVLAKNNFEESLIKGAKDCFIAKRIAIVMNFNEETGISVTFLQPMNFVYETEIGDRSKITKFVSFTDMNERSMLTERRIFKKTFILGKDTTGNEICYFSEAIYDGRGALIEELSEMQPTLLDRIPVVIITNDGLTGERTGESDIAGLLDYESWFSKLSNSDIDSERKSMNPIKYTVDMDPTTTKNLSTAAGSFWDLMSDQNLDNGKPAIGMLTSSLEYSQALGATLDRIKSSAYEQVEMPNITLESMAGVITSGKALKSIYWPLIVRCKEKMKTWGPQLRDMADIIIKGGMAYPEVAAKYTNEFLSPVDYEIHVVENYPLPEDEVEEKEMDLAEVTANTMSKKAYMKKWRKLSDDEAQEELEQMALERQMLEDSVQDVGAADPLGGMAE